MVAFFTLVATLVVYYTLPVYDHSRGPWLPLRIAVFITGLAGVGYLFTRQVALSRTAARAQQQVQWLFTAICLVVVGFSVYYFVIAHAAAGQIVGIRTKTDALYFTVTVLTTVGFGDVHAVGQATRAVVTVQMGFDVLFIATAAAALRESGMARRRARS